MLKKLYLLFICSFCILAICNAQNASSDRNAVVAKFVHHLNEKNFDSIYLMYVPETTKTLTREKNYVFCNDFVKQAGSVKEYMYVDDLTNYARFKATMTKGTYWMNVSTKGEKIVYFYFYQYDGK